MSDDDDDDRLLGKSLASQFHLQRRLGSGGMGAVYIAEQTEMGRRVVVKVMHPELTVNNPSAVERFKREARAVAALNHPHIVQIYVFGQSDDGRLYIAMEYIEGRDLGAEIKKAPFEDARAIKVLDQVAAALVEAHSRGIVHRDLKPENVMLAQRHGNPDFVKVLDFGIAKIAAAEGKDQQVLTQQGAIFGTPRYMAPEQILGGTIDARTDIYALGMIFYEMITQRHPFGNQQTMDYLVKHVQEEVVMPSIAYPDLGVHPEVERILERMLAKDPAERYQSAAELQRDLRAALPLMGEALSHTMSISQAALEDLIRQKQAANATPRRSRTWLWVTLACVLVGGGTAAAILATSGTGSAPPTPPTSPVIGKPLHDPAALAALAATLDAHPDAGAHPDPTQPSRPDAATAPADLPRAGSPIEGFPVPEGVTLVDSDSYRLTLETTLPPARVLAFYEAELVGRVRSSGSGLEVTDPSSPWRFILFQRDGDRLRLLVNRRGTP